LGSSASRSHFFAFYPSSKGLPTARDRSILYGRRASGEFGLLQTSQNREVTLVHQLTTKAGHISDASFFVFVSSAVLLRESNLEAGTKKLKKPA
jgi:hypothetical protein